MISLAHIVEIKCSLVPNNGLGRCKGKGNAHRQASEQDRGVYIELPYTYEVEGPGLYNGSEDRRGECRIHDGDSFPANQSIALYVFEVLGENGRGVYCNAASDGLLRDAAQGKTTIAWIQNR